MNESIPSLREWRGLYQAVTEFKKIECWNWMSDADLFGVQNPADGTIGYCCIMGEMKEMLGLVVYLGTEGLAGYLKIQSGSQSSDAVDFLHLQRCLTLTFENRKYLQEPDLKIIKSLGLKFRGQQDWPLFRDYRPGYLPWYLTKEEVRYLIALIPQVMEVAFRMKENAHLLVAPVKNHYLIRVPERAGDDFVWSDEWREPAPVRETEENVSPVDELHLQRIKRTVLRRQGTWEIDQFYSPGVVDEGERPYFPNVFLWVDHDTGLVLHVRVAPLSNYQSDFQDQFMGLLEKTKTLPEEILFENDKPFKLVEPITSRLGIKLTRVRNLPALEEARSGLFSFFKEK